ncbi:hypothetical protein K4B79_17555 [Streptomyces lincolnensis]|uniref:hypothetical protein n=1 Tax=Streptomyces lincolnensis TaxID=1915 RepID=UPI001E2E56BB|nr:hypothetical protein [Streptomyces lincolnensis]MCD7440025.1 hypothetical protein [Streptomyces lincolnensis]
MTGGVRDAGIVLWLPRPGLTVALPWFYDDQDRGLDMREHGPPPAGAAMRAPGDA